MYSWGSNNGHNPEPCRYTNSSNIRIVSGGRSAEIAPADERRILFLCPYLCLWLNWELNLEMGIAIGLVLVALGAPRVRPPVVIAQRVTLISQSVHLNHALFFDLTGKFEQVFIGVATFFLVDWVPAFLVYDDGLIPQDILLGIPCFIHISAVLVIFGLGAVGVHSAPLLVAVFSSSNQASYLNLTEQVAEVGIDISPYHAVVTRHGKGCRSRWRHFNSKIYFNYNTVLWIDTC